MYIRIKLYVYAYGIGKRLTILPMSGRKTGEWYLTILKCKWI